MRYLSALPFLGNTSIRSVSIEESLKALHGPRAPSLPLSVLPTKVQEKLNRGEQVTPEEIASVLTSTLCESR
jgi:hypothetical protein